MFDTNVIKPHQKSGIVLITVPSLVIASKNNQENEERLENTLEKFCILKIKKTSKFQLNREITNIAISEGYTGAADAEK